MLSEPLETRSACTLLIYGLLGLAALAFGVWSFVSGAALAGAVLSPIGAFFLWNVIASRNNSARPVIDRLAVRSVEAQPPRPPITRGYFIVKFEENGKMRKRLIVLPGSMDDGGAEYARAEGMMRAAGLLSIA